MAVSPNEHLVTVIDKDNETTCWGCGLNLVLPSYIPTFKCGWCGAITSLNVQKLESKCFRWRRLRDRCFVCVLFGFMGFVICGGVWAVYPVVFSISYFCWICHSIITICLSVSTLSTFILAAFRCPGAPPNILWGSYPLVEKGDLENYTFCHYCSKPKSPRAHHCRSCGMCVLNMDHHCPFIGNCVGAANHRNFILFLISAVASMIYVTVMSVKAGLHIWPPLSIKPHSHANVVGTDLAMRFVKEIVFALLNSAMLMSSRGLLLVYLFISSLSLNLGLSVLLWQQLFYIYEGKTYLSHLSSRGGDGAGKKDCQNILRFFGCPYSVSRYLPVVRDSEKRH